MKEHRVRASARHQSDGPPKARVASSPPSLALAFIAACAPRSRARARRPGVIVMSGANDVNLDGVFF